MTNQFAPDDLSVRDESSERVTILGAGEMAALIRAKDWATTALGALEGWSAELLSVVQAMVSAPMPMFVMWGPDLVMFYNDAARPITSAKHPGCLGQRSAEAWKEAWHIIGRQLEQVLRDGRAIEQHRVMVPLEMGGKLKDMYLDYTYSPLFAGGKIAGVLVLCRDITEALLREAALTDAEAASRQMAERLEVALAVANGVGIWDWDVERNCVYTDARFAVLYGVDPEAAAKGLPIAEFMRCMHPDDRPAVSAAIAQAIESGDEYEAEYRLVQANGRVRWVAAKGRCVFGQGGAPLRFPGVTVDVTDRKEMEQALRGSEERLTLAAHTAGLGIWELDLRTGKMNCTELCKANYGRTSADRFDYAELRNSIYPEDAPAMQAAVDTALATRTMYRAEYRVVWPDETVHWVVASGRAFYGEAGEVVRMAGVTLDVTDRHQAQAAMMQTEKLAAVGRLAASIAHEINNPLEAVTNLLYLARGSGSVEEIQGYLETAEQELQRVSTIANQTLRFYKQSTRPMAVSCDELFRGVLAIHSGRLSTAKVEVIKRKRAKQNVCCFEGEIRQVLNNLVGNAIDAMQPDGGRLLLRSADGTNWKTMQRGLTLTVADTGVGMPPKVVTRIFDAFFTTKGIGGTGLGLWVSQEIIARHHGTIAVRSRQAAGRSGTVMRMFLPLDAVAR